MQKLTAHVAAQKTVDWGENMLKGNSQGVVIIGN